MSKKQYLNLDDFERQDFIGKGGFSEVFKIKEKKTGKILAAKISLKRLNGNTKEIKQLKTNLVREVNIISRLRNPCVLKYIGYSPTDFNEEPKPVIVTQYYTNGSLERIINLNRLQLVPKSWTATKKLINIYGIASGVSYLHSRDILHRDLKPQNILEDENLFPSIADFGIAQVSHQKQDGTVYQPNIKVMGTPIYVAPEIWIKNAYSPASDVYSFSLIVYEIMTNEIPFKGYNQDKIFDEIIQNRNRPEFKCPIPDSYRNLIESCWLDDPTKRPTFDAILFQLKNDLGFITENVDKDEFFDYVEYIDQFHSSHDISQPILSYEEIKVQRKIRAIELKKEEELELQLKAEMEQTLQMQSQQQTQELEIQIDSQHTKEFEMDSLPQLQSQNEITNSMKLKTKKKKSGTKPKQIQLSSIKGFLDLSEETQQFLQQIIDKQKLKTKQISMSASDTLTLFKNGSFKSAALIDFLKYFDDISIEIAYPSNFFELLFISLSSLKKSKLSKLKMVINISSITSIGNSAFYGCSTVSKIYIPPSVKSIGKDAFYGCSSLSQIAIPSSVISIGEHAFSGCSSLKEISIPPSVKSIGKDCFYGCSSLTKNPLS